MKLCFYMPGGGAMIRRGYNIGSPGTILIIPRNGGQGNVLKSLISLMEVFL